MRLMKYRVLSFCLLLLDLFVALMAMASLGALARPRPQGAGPAYLIGYYFGSFLITGILLVVDLRLHRKLRAAKPT
jgi:ABC-type uncharacterized transport system permease subunit